MYYSHADNPATMSKLIPTETRTLLRQIVQCKEFTPAEAKRIIRQIANHAIFSIQSHEYKRMINFNPSGQLMRSFAFHRTIEGQKYWLTIATKLGER